MQRVGEGRFPQPVEDVVVVAERHREIRVVEHGLEALLGDRDDHRVRGRGQQDAVQDLTAPQLQRRPVGPHGRGGIARPAVFLGLRQGFG